VDPTGGSDVAVLGGSPLSLSTTLEGVQLIRLGKMRAQSSHPWLKLNKIVDATGQQMGARLDPSDESFKIANGDFFKVW
jgi:hypothetical protein